MQWRALVFGLIAASVVSGCCSSKCGRRATVSSFPSCPTCSNSPPCPDGRCQSTVPGAPTPVQAYSQGYTPGAQFSH